MIHRGPNHGLGVFGLGDVGVHVDGLATRSGHLVCGCPSNLVGDIGQDDAGTLCGEQRPGDLPHPAGRAGDQRDLPVQSAHAASFLVGPERWRVPEATAALLAGQASADSGEPVAIRRRSRRGASP